jgi:hypothetical protein
MWEWLRELFNPTVDLKPEPLQVNPSPSVRAQRNDGRCERLRAAIAAGDTRQSLKDELARREKGGR